MSPVNGQERFVGALRQVFERRERERAPLRTVRVVGRNEDGTLLRVRSDAECVLRGDAETHFLGQTVVEPAGTGSPIRRQGTSGVAPLREESVATTLWVERLDPDVYRPGESYIVEVHGRGFDARVRFEFLRPGYDGQRGEINPAITIHSTAIESATLAVLEIEVAPDSPFFDHAPLAYGREAP